MEDDFDDFFDSPRHNVVETRSLKSSHTVDVDITASKNFRCDENSHKLAGKPPTHPKSRPVSAAINRTPTSPGSSVTDGPQAHGSRRVIEAKVPYDDGGSYSDDSFVAEDDGGSSAEEDSGRRSPIPRTDNPNQQLMSKEMPVSGRDARPLVTEDSARELSDYSDNYSDVIESDTDSDVIDVSPLNTPHSPKIQTASACSSSPNKNVSRSSNREPVRLLHGDRDSLDLDVLLQTVLQMEKQGRSQSRQTQPAATSRGSRVNYSFTNEQVNAIDKENRRLMTSIMRHANATKKAKAKANKHPTVTSVTTTKRPSSAAVNRAKQQQKIEVENLMLLKRLQQTRPTKELRRDLLSGSGRGGSMKHADMANTSSAQRPGSGMRQWPTSAQRLPCTSRPTTAFSRQPDDDDILTWQTDDF